MSEREQIIGRIREALRLEAHRPEHAQISSHGTQTDATPRKWLPIVPDDYEGQVELFSKNCDELKTRFLRVAALSDIVGKLSEWKNAEAWKLVASHHAPLLDAIVSFIGLPALFTEDRPTTNEIERADVGITLCDALIAQTGSILLTTLERRRKNSFSPPASPRSNRAGESTAAGSSGRVRVVTEDV